MIGIFDSGSGGLTVLRSIRAVMPSSDILYFGDIKNAPYGERSREELSRLTIDAIRLLMGRGATSIVSACNSVSASLAVSLFDSLDIEPIQLIEMVGPTVSTFRGSSARILLAATPATIESDIYQSAFRMIGLTIKTMPLPGLAGAIEFGKDAEAQKLIQDACASIDRGAYDTLILGCTHYPLVRHLFEASVPQLSIFDPAEAIAERVERRFWPRESGDGRLSFRISADSPQFRARVAQLFPNEQYEIEVI